jgi:hypothetical protein
MAANEDSKASALGGVNALRSFNSLVPKALLAWPTYRRPQPQGKCEAGARSKTHAVRILIGARHERLILTRYAFAFANGGEALARAKCPPMCG